MEADCPYKEIDQNFIHDFVKNYTCKKAETFTVVSSNRVLQIFTQKKA